MTAPKNARRGRGGRYYPWPSLDRETTDRYWSVTTIIDGGLPKPALMGWAVKQTAIFAIEKCDLIKQLVDEDRVDGKLVIDEDTGKPVGDNCQIAYKMLWDSRWAKAEKAAQLGTRIHEAIETYVLDKPAPEWPEDIAPFLENAVHFLTDFGVLVEMTEASVYHRKQKYAGTLDMIATINGERWLIDFKTGKGVYPEAALQMAAYANAEFIGKPDHTEEPMPKIERAGVVHLQADGYKLLPVDISEPVYQHFLYARENFRWLEVTSKEVIGDALQPGVSA